MRENENEGKPYLINEFIVKNNNIIIIIIIIIIIK